MGAFHFDPLLFPDEAVVWSGQPEEEAFHLGELRLSHNVACVTLAVGLFQAVGVFWRHPTPHTFSGGGVMFAFWLLPAAAIKYLPVLNQSSAGHYWYALTDQRVLVEVPDEGTQTVISINLSDVRDVSLKLGGTGVGTITLVSESLSHKKVCLKCINDAEHVYRLLKRQASANQGGVRDAVDAE